MNLNNFEDYVDRVIYQRGYDYYSYGHVFSIEEVQENVFVAEVEGAYTYTVRIELDANQDVAYASCDCPYTGEYCKHQVAALLALKDEVNEVSSKRVSTDSAVMTAVSTRSTPALQQLLSTRTKHELVAFLQRLALDSEEVKQRILLEFSATDEEAEMRDAVALIQTYIENNSDEDGFVDYRNADDAVYGSFLVLEKAGSLLGQHEVLRAINLALCVVEEMVDLMQYGDDSDGVIGGAVQDGFNFIRDAIEDAELSLFESNIVFEKLMKAATHGRLDGWIDWRLEFLEICAQMSYIPELRSRLERFMALWEGDADSDSWSDNYLAERLNQIRYSMIHQNEGAETAERFVVQNLKFTCFRKMAIMKAMEQGDYDRVISLAIEGEAKDKGWRGLLNDWKNYRYTAYRLANRIDEQRQLALDFVLDGNYEFYIQLKATYGAEEWETVYPEIIASLKNEDRVHTDIYVRVLIEEEEWHRLLQYVERNPASIEKYYGYLLSQFREEVYELFITYIEIVAARATSRAEYRRVCDVIRNLKKAGGNEHAQKIKEAFFVKYARKPAFKDELTRV